MELKIRKATASDAKEILSVTKTAFLRYSSGVGKNVAALNENEDIVAKEISNKHVLVATFDNKIVGCIRYEVIDVIAYISRFCSIDDTIKPSVGKSLMEKVNADCTELGLNALCLHTSTKLTNLVKFYYKCGFYVFDVDHKRGYPRGLFVCPLTNDQKDYIALTDKK